MIISGSSKAGKTLSLLHLGLAAANGEPWLGHNTHKEGSKVIYLDFELKPRMAAKRIAEMVKSIPAMTRITITSYIVDSEASPVPSKTSYTT